MRQNVSNTTDFARNPEWARPARNDEGAANTIPAKLPVFQIAKSSASNYAVYDRTTERAGSLHTPSKPLGGSLKRMLDIMVSVSALCMALPLMLVVAAVLKFSGGPVFFVHDRIGFGGRIFGCLKFRTMVQNPNKTLQDHLAANPDAMAEWQETQKLKNDPRITFLGHMLRRSSIDELPQLINIIRGQMSCVGPRPVMADELERYGDDAALYLQTRPGLTGLWQISGRNRISYEERVALDCDYIRRWSLGRDIAILFRTIFAVMRTDETS